MGQAPNLLHDHRAVQPQLYHCLSAGPEASHPLFIKTEEDIFDIPYTQGHPFFPNAINPLLQESIARRLSAGTYVQRALQEVEHFNRHGHRLALASTLAKANNFLSHLEAADYINPDRYTLEDLLSAIGHDPDSDEAARWLELNVLPYDEDDPDQDE